MNHPPIPQTVTRLMQRPRDTIAANATLLQSRAFMAASRGHGIDLARIAIQQDRRAFDLHAPGRHFRQILVLDGPVPSIGLGWLGGLVHSNLIFKSEFSSQPGGDE